MYENIKYLILNTNEAETLDFSLLLEDSFDTARKTVDGTKILISWEGDEPDFVLDINSKEGPYDYNTALSILNSPPWIIL
jgi:hypothetical protein